MSAIVVSCASYLRRFERSEVERMIDVTRAELAAVRRQVDEWTARRDAPDRGEVVTALRAISAIGAARAWDNMGDPGRRGSAAVGRKTGGSAARYRQAATRRARIGLSASAFSRSSASAAPVLFGLR